MHEIVGVAILKWSYRYTDFDYFSKRIFDLFF